VTAVLVGGMGETWRALDGWDALHASAGRRVCGYDYDSCRQSMSEAATGLEAEIEGLAAGGTRELFVTGYSMGGWIAKAALDQMAESGSLQRFDRVDLVTLGTPWGGYSRGNAPWHLRGFPTPGAARGFARMIHRPMAFEIGAKSDFVRARQAALPEHVRFVMYDGGADRTASPRTREEQENYAAVVDAATRHVSVPGASHGDLRLPEVVAPDVEDAAGKDPAPGDRVRIVAADFKSDRFGVVTSIDAGGLRVRPTECDCAESVPVPWESIGRLEVARGKTSMAGHGALWGGLGAGGMVLAMVVHSRPSTGEGQAVAALAVMASAGIGSAVGAIVGRFLQTDNWVRWDHTERPPRWRVDVTPVPRGAGVALTWELAGGRGRR
jgi:hypothetical protein